MDLIELTRTIQADREREIAATIRRRRLIPGIPVRNSTPVARAVDVSHHRSDATPTRTASGQSAAPASR